MRKKIGFTLVELIIVVAIIAILTFAAFLFLSKWIGKSRNSGRVADINQIVMALQLFYNEKETYPAPSKAITIDLTGNLLGSKALQGVFDDDVKAKGVGINIAPKDPLDNDYYTYTRIDFGPRGIEVGGMLEDSTVIGYDNKAYAESMTREPYIINTYGEGNFTGIIMPYISLRQKQKGYLNVQSAGENTVIVLNPNKTISQIQGTVIDLDSGNVICINDVIPNFMQSTKLICEIGNHSEDKQCMPNTSTCVVDNGGGTKTWNTGTNLRNECMTNGCNAAYHLSGNSCVSDTKSCSVTNGSGNQTWDGAARGTCLVSSCNTSYHINSNACISDTQSCSITNGVGSQTWNGTDRGTCTPTGCNSGYHVSANACVSNTQSCYIANGVGSQTWNGTARGTCTVTSCNPGFNVSGNSCSAKYVRAIAGECTGIKCQAYTNCDTGRQRTSSFDGGRRCRATSNASGGASCYCQRDDGSSPSGPGCSGTCNSN